MRQSTISYLIFHTFTPYKEIKVVMKDALLWLNKKQISRLFSVPEARIKAEIEAICKEEDLSQEEASFYLPVPKANFITHDKCFEVQLVLKVGKRLNSPVFDEFNRWVEAQISQLN